MRKVVQVSAFPGFTYAVCDDGTLWEKHPGTPWFQIEAPPSPPVVDPVQDNRGDWPVGGNVVSSTPPFPPRKR